MRRALCTRGTRALGRAVRRSRRRSAHRAGSISRSGRTSSLGGGARSPRSSCPSCPTAHRRATYAVAASPARRGGSLSSERDDNVSSLQADARVGLFGRFVQRRTDCSLARRPRPTTVAGACRTHIGSSDAEVSNMLGTPPSLPRRLGSRRAVAAAMVLEAPGVMVPARAVAPAVSPSAVRGAAEP